ncbi:hypothetical protein Q5752_003315 [Cryptotrichosporon argae]
MAPRTVGLPYHLGYPIVSFVLLALAAFASADDIWYASVATDTELVRFGATNYCGYTLSSSVITSSLGCLYRGFSYTLPSSYFGFALPSTLTHNLAPTAATSAAAFALVLVAGLHHAYVIRYSYRKNPEPNKDKLWSLTQIHAVSVGITFVFTWVAFAVQAGTVGSATSWSDSASGSDAGATVTVYWGQAPWLVLASAVLHAPWGWEAVRWRASQL